MYARSPGRGAHLGERGFEVIFLVVLKVVCIFVVDKKGFEEAGRLAGFIWLL